MKNVNPFGIELVGFDAWSTLIRIKSSTVRAYDTWAAMLQHVKEVYGPQYADPDCWTAVYRQVKPVAERMSEVSGRHVGITERVIMTLLGLGIPASNLQIDKLAPAIQRTSATIANMSLELVDIDSIKHLTKLRESGIAIGLVSNLGVISANAMRRGFKSVGLGGIFGFELYSDEVGLCKPNPAIFGELCHRAGVSPEKTLFIGDNFEADYLGALNYGMKAVWLSTHPRPDVTSAVNVSEALQLFGLC